MSGAGANLTPRRRHIAAVSGHPWGAGQPLKITWTVRDSSTLAVFDPELVLRAELIDRDGLTILETVDAPPGAAGVYTVDFAAVESPGRYWARLVWQEVDDPTYPEVVWVDEIQVEDLGSVVIAGVMSIDELLDGYLGRFPGEPAARDLLRGDNGEQLLGDAALAQAIIDEASYVERRLDVTLRLRRYAARPEIARPGGSPLVQGIDYDVEVDPLDFDHAHSGTLHGLLVLPHTHVKRVTRARLIYGQTVLWDLPTRWFQLRHRAGAIYLVVDSTDLDATGQGVTFSAIFALVNAWIATGHKRVPLAWCIDYEAGLSDLSDYQDLRALVAWRAVARVLGLAAVKANKQAVSSQSTGKDGLSRSMSVGDSGPGGRFSRLLDSPVIKEYLDPEMLKTMRNLIRPGLRIY